MSEAIVMTVADGVAHLRFNRPERLNAIDLDTANAFEAAVERVVEKPDIGALVLSGEGRAFVAGGDLAYLHAADKRGNAARALIDPMHAALCRLRTEALPTIAVLHGPVAGAGMSLAMFSDLAVAAETAVFNMAYLGVAASPDCGGAWSLARSVGRRKAMEIALLGRSLTADEALALGLVNAVTSAETAEATGLEWARRIADGPRDAIRRTHALIDGAEDTSFQAHLAQEMEAFARGAEGSEFAEALDAFFEKRPPDFRAVRRRADASTRKG